MIGAVGEKSRRERIIPFGVTRCTVLRERIRLIMPDLACQTFRFQNFDLRGKHRYEKIIGAGRDFLADRDGLRLQGRERDFLRRADIFRRGGGMGA